MNNTICKIDPWDSVAVIYNQRKKFLVPVAQPLILISEVQRSGGTLLTQLLDGHPQLHVHPSELHIGRPNKYHWPKLDIGLPPDVLFDQLWEHPALLHARDGYSKSGKRTNASLPFVFLGSLQRILFRELLNSGYENQRDILNAYVTSYFNSWIDYNGLYRNSDYVKYWVTFVARLLFIEENIDNYFLDYPDGYFVSIIREPVSWYASASNYMPDQYGDVNSACELWNMSTLSAIREYKKNADRVLLLSFEKLVTDTIDTLNILCKFVGINMYDIVPAPTFNNMYIEGNSSFCGTSNVIMRDSSDRSSYVEESCRSKITKLCEKTYKESSEIIRHQITTINAKQ